MAEPLFVFDQASMLKLRADHNRLKGILTELQQRVAALQHSGPAAPFLIGKVDSDIAAGASGEISIWGLRAGVDADLDYNLTAYDWTLGGATAGDKVHVWRHQQSGRMYFGGGSGLRLGKADADISAGAGGVVSLWTGAPGSEVDSGEDLTAFAGFQPIGSGTWVLLVNFGSGWYGIPLECP